MSTHPPVHLIRQDELHAPVDRLAQHGVPVEKILAAVGVPVPPDQTGHEFVPARRLLKVLAEGSRYLEEEDFTFRAVLEADDSRVGSWGEQAPRCWRLRDALDLFVRRLMNDVTFLTAGMHFGDDHVSVYRRRFLPPKDLLSEQQGEQYVLASMVRVVRGVAGSSWFPKDVHIESHTSEWLPRVAEAGESRVHFGADVLAIEVPYDLLDLRLVHGSPADPTPVGPPLPDAALDLAGSLLQALLPLVGTEHLSMDLAAEIAETSPRTLQRRLVEEGTSFRGIQNRILFEAAEERLKDPTRPLAEISAELGYANEANFSRAFRRWSGECPSAYRRRRQSRRQCH